MACGMEVQGIKPAVATRRVAYVVSASRCSRDELLDNLESSLCMKSGVHADVYN